MDAEIVFGPPGTGKTTYLVNRAKEFVDIYKKKVLFLSFTRAAAIEAQSRINSDLVNVRTIHSLGYQVAGISRGQVVDFRKLGEFGRKVGFPIKGGDLESEEGIADGDRLLAIMNLAIAKKQSLSTTYMESDRPVNFKSFEFFVNSYINWKTQFGYVDFNDMLSMFPEEPMQCDSIIVDESQDLSPLQWEVISKLLSNCKRCVIAGDDDQCQVAGTMVLTPDGEKPIEELVNGDKVISYSQQHSSFSARSVKVASRYISQDIINVVTSKNSSRYTMNHKCMVKFKYDPDLRVVYLMQKGDRFRIGETKAFKKNKTGFSLYPVVRARQEKADNFWILSTHKSKKESYSEEQYLSLKFGVPQTVFNYKGIGVDCDVEHIWKKFDSLNMKNRVINLLNDIGLDFNLPHIHHNGGTKFFKCYAVNLNTDLHQVAVYKDDELNWMDFDVNVEYYEGFVFSLEVEKTGTYIADGIYTHNSIYEWGGADIHGLQKFEANHHAKRTILGQSYRVPKSVHKLSQDLISRIDGRVEKIYLPTEVEGEVKKYGSPDLVKYDPKVDTLVLYRNHMFRKELESVLINNCIPYVADAGFPSLMDNKYGKGIRSFKKLKNGEMVTGLELDQIKNVANPRIAGLIKDRNFKGLPDSWKLAIYVPHIWSNYYSRVDMTAEPKLHISSIHGSKGREADRVIVHTGLTQRTYQGLGEDPDPETRVFYVAITRARHQLDLIDGVRGFQI